MRTQRPARSSPGAAPEGLEHFVAEQGRPLFRLAVILSADVRSGEDLYQETMRRLVVHWAGLDNPAAWCRRVMRNLAIDRSRSLRSRREVVTETDALPVADPSSGRAHHAAELRQELLAALGDLSPGQREVVALRYLDDCSEAEVAGLLGVPVGTVKSTASRAVARLRRHPRLLAILDADDLAG